MARVLIDRRGKTCVEHGGKAIFVVDVNPGLCDHAPWFDWQRSRPPSSSQAGYYATPAGFLAEAEDAERLLAGAVGDAVREPRDGGDWGGIGFIYARLDDN